MNFNEVVNNNYSKLNENDLYILKYVSTNKSKCVDLSINKLAEKCNVSRTTILRFTQKLGFKGYSEFKVFLRWEDENGAKETDTDYIDEFYLDFEETKKQLKRKNLLEICELINSAERVFIYGTGMTQTAVAKEMQRTFLVASEYFYVVEGEMELRTVVSDISEKDLLIIISLSGNREFLKEITTVLKMRGIKYISMTKISDNMLARNASYNLYISTTTITVDKGRHHEATAFFFLLVDILFREYLKYIKDKSIITEGIINEESTKKEK